MKISRQIAAAGLFAGSLLIGVGPLRAQTTAPSALPDPSAAAASAPSAAASPVPSGPRAQRPRTSAETGNRAAAPGDLRPERPVTPQISIPLGKKAPPPAPRQDGAPLSGNPAGPGAIDDAAGRCESQIDAQLRADCRARLARESKGRVPG